MPVDTAQFRARHAALKGQTALLREAALDIPMLSTAERAAVRERALAYLTDVVDPHTRLDERLLFPAVGKRLGDPLATAPMAYDPLAIRYWTGELAATSPDEPDKLQELLYGLDALIRVHLWKEDELYLAMLESPSWPSG